jgi:UDP-3-O-[3-hydroxymyristoyl] glucosamine N-acyltransferase|tara:strand:+ start:514 stop:1539 length:1026 start_codon:yes stop_codon:yes gene_type:complete
MLTLAQIALHVDGVIIGDAECEISNVSTLQAANRQQISFLANSKYKKYLPTSQAGAVIVSKEMAELVKNSAIVVDDPYVAYAKIATLLNPPKKITTGISPTAMIEAGVTILKTVSIGPQVVIEANVILADNVVIGAGTVLQDEVIVGENTRIAENVTICHGVEIGKNVVIHPGVVIGADGFGIVNDKGKWIKIPQIGRVKIGDNVEIGANTTVDRGAIEDTVIGDGVKLDNQIQVGHNVIIGNNTVIAGCSGVAGSTIIGENCIIGGGVGIGGHIEIADNVIITGMSMVTKSLTKAGIYSSGIPAEPTSQWHKNVVRYRQMDKLVARVKKLEDPDIGNVTE